MEKSLEKDGGWNGRENYRREREEGEKIQRGLSQAVVLKKKKGENLKI